MFSFSSETVPSMPPEQEVRRGTATKAYYFHTTSSDVGDENDLGIDQEVREAWEVCIMGQYCMRML